MSSDGNGDDEPEDNKKLDNTSLSPRINLRGDEKGLDAGEEGNAALYAPANLADTSSEEEGVITKTTMRTSSETKLSLAGAYSDASDLLDSSSEEGKPMENVVETPVSFDNYSAFDLDDDIPTKEDSTISADNYGASDLLNDSDEDITPPKPPATLPNIPLPPTPQTTTLTSASPSAPKTISLRPKPISVQKFSSSAAQPIRQPQAATMQQSPPQSSPLRTTSASVNKRRPRPSMQRSLPPKVNLGLRSSAGECSSNTTIPSPLPIPSNNPLDSDTLKWTIEFQHLLEQPESPQKYFHLGNLARDFLYVAEQYGR